MERQTLDEAIHSKIRDLCAKGDALVQEKQFEQAFGFYRDALNLVPPPAEDWEATTWILAAIGDLYFMAKMTPNALKAFEDAVRCPGGLGNPFIHLRLGQCYLDLGQEDRAADELTRAYMAQVERSLRSKTSSTSSSLEPVSSRQPARAGFEYRATARDRRLDLTDGATAGRSRRESSFRRAKNFGAAPIGANRKKFITAEVAEDR